MTFLSFKCVYQQPFVRTRIQTANDHCHHVWRSHSQSKLTEPIITRSSDALELHHRLKHRQNLITKQQPLASHDCQHHRQHRPSLHGTWKPTSWIQFALNTTLTHNGKPLRSARLRGSSIPPETKTNLARAPASLIIALDSSRLRRTLLDASSTLASST